MARVELALEVFDYFDRLFDHMARFEVGDAPARIGEIVQAIQILTHSPLIGRLVKGGRRELVIGRDSYGYVALYRFVVSIDTVFVLAIRSQREAGYKRERRPRASSAKHAALRVSNPRGAGTDPDMYIMARALAANGPRP